MLWRIPKRVFGKFVGSPHSFQLADAKRPQMFVHIPHGVEFEMIAKIKMKDSEVWMELCFTNFS
jgi:hypothetical protein